MAENLTYYDSPLTGEELDAAFRKLPQLDASVAAAAQSAEQAAQSAQQALGFRTFFSAIIPGASGNLDPSRSVKTPSAQASWTIESRGDRIQSVQVNGFAQQAGTGDPSPANVRGITVAAQNKTLPVTLTGHKTVTETLSLTLPLCNGDTVESCVLSGCDKKIVLDGSGYWQATGSNGQYYSDIMADPVASNTVLGYVFSDTLHRDTAANGYTGTVCICVNQNGNICVTLPGGASPASYFMEHPAIVYYRSSAYTEAADIPLQLESYQNGFAVFTGGTSESWTQEGTRFWTSVPGASLDSARKSVLCSVGVFNASASTTSFVCFVSGGKFFFYPDQSQSWTVQSFKSWLSGLSNAGTPMQVVYPLATTEVYARDPVTLVAVPYTSADSSQTPGTYVVSSQDGTTVAVSLKAFQDGGTPSVQALLNLVYPVGSIYMSATNVSPQVFLGGTWQQIQGQFLLAASGSYPAGSTGGEAEHTLTNEELPKYTNGQVYSGNTNTNNVSSWLSVPKGTNMAYGALSLGGGQAHNNMPPYLAVYMWQRTA